METTNNQYYDKLEKYNDAKIQFECNSNIVCEIQNLLDIETDKFIKYKSFSNIVTTHIELETFIQNNKDTIDVTMPTPADGPSFGVAPSGT